MEPFVVVQIERVEGGPFGRCNPYCVLSVGQLRWELPVQSRRSQAQWTVPGVQWEVQDEKDARGVVIHVSFWHRDRWKKDRLLGEANIDLPVLLGCAAHVPENFPSRAAGGGEPQHDVCRFPLRLEKGKAKEGQSGKGKEEGGKGYGVDGEEEPTVQFYVQVTGWKLLYSMLRDQSTVSKALMDLSALADLKTSKKASSYIRKELLKYMKKLALRSATPVEVKELVAIAWGKLARRDDDSVLLMVKQGALHMLSRLITRSKEPKIQAMFIEHTKCFFKYVGHQKELVKRGILSHLIELISSPHIAVQTKAFEALLHFDSVHQADMVKRGIFNRLNKLIFAENLQIQTRALAVIQYFDSVHQEQMIQDGILDSLLKLITVNKPSLQLKVLSVIQHFDAKYHDSMMKTGLVSQLAFLMSSDNVKLRLKAFEVIQCFVGSHQDELITAGILEHLLKFLNSEDQMEIKLKALDIISQFNATHTIEEGLLKYIIGLITTHDASPDLQSKSFEVLLKMSVSHQEEMFKEGVLTHLLELIAIHEPLSLHDGGDEISKGPDTKLREDNSVYYLDMLNEPADFSSPMGGTTKWSCSACTFLNPFTVSACSICDTPCPPNPHGTLGSSGPPRSISEMVWPSSAEDGYNETQQEAEEAQEVENDEFSPIAEAFGLGPVHTTSQLSMDDTTGNVSPLPKLGEDRRGAEEDAVQIPHDDMEASGTTRVNLANEDDPWNCGSCTLLNPPHATHCEICGSEKQINFPFEPVSPEEESYSMEAPLAVSTDTNNTTVLAEQEDLVIEQSPSQKRQLTDQQTQLILQILRNFDVEYQSEMIELGVLASLKRLISNPNLQTDAIKTISYFEALHQKDMIHEGIILCLVTFLTKKNARPFLSAIERFQGYQQELMKEGMMRPILKLLSFDDIQLQSRVSEFIMSFKETFRPAIMEEVRHLARKSEEIPPYITSPVSADGKTCNLCGGIEGHLTTCTLSPKKVQITAPVNHGLMSQAKKLLWQLEHKGIRLLKYKVIYNDGGEYSRKYRVTNVLNPQSSVYSSESTQPTNIIFEYEGKGIPYITHVIIKAPRIRFDSPVKTAAVFISDKPPVVTSTKKYDKLSAKEFGKLEGPDQHDPSRPVALLDLGDSTYAETAVRECTQATYIHLKLLTALKKNFDVEYIGFVGGTTESPVSNSDKESLTSINDVGNHLGVRKRVKRLDYDFDFGNGLLHWIGTNGGEKSWVNPVTTEQVSITTSNAMYSMQMRTEDIISRQAGTSCYWGSSCPQYFILDLKHRRLRCNYFTLRHGYQAANSYIQNWNFAGSNDVVNWTILYEGGETPFSKAFDTKSWPIPDGKDYFRYFRILQKGNYSMGKGTSGGGSAYLCISGFELYGELLRD